MGAVAIEKHYTSDPTRDGPDHRFSATPDIMKKIANGVDDIMKLRGSSKKGSGQEELVNKAIGRRSAFASKDLPKGTIITRDDLRFIRPNAGIPANDVSGVLGKTLCRPILKGHPITYSDISGI